MVLQLEKFSDILKALHPGIDLFFLLNRPCRNDVGIEDRLNLMRTNNGYGGAQ